MWQIHTDETKSSLQFASRALRVTNCAKVNEVCPKPFPSFKELFYFDHVLFILVLHDILLYFSVSCALSLFISLSLSLSLSSILFKECIFIALFLQAGSIIDEKMFLLSKLLSDYAFVTTQLLAVTGTQTTDT